MRTDKKRRMRCTILLVCLCGLIVCGGVFLALMRGVFVKPEDVVEKYFSLLRRGQYEDMYRLLTEESRREYTGEEYIGRNQKIFEGLETKDVTVRISDVYEQNGGTVVRYFATYDTIAGEIQTENRMSLQKSFKKGFGICWEDSLIFPKLEKTDRVLITTLEPKRGAIRDRNGRMLAGEGTASSVGLVPGKMEKDKDSSVQVLAQLLETSREAIENKLHAAWVKEDSFVPLKTLDKVDTLAHTLNEEEQQNKELQEALLEIPGVMITDTTVRTYPLKEAAAHLTGYVQGITAEELQELKDKGYSQSSLIGKSGLESLYEEQLAGKTGYRVTIVTKDGREKAVVGVKKAKDGQDITVTIDGELQRQLYEELKDDKGTCAAVNPKTGEVLALVSTPSYSPDLFVRGMTEEQWQELNDEKRMPLQNRFRAAWCPGSSFKPVIGAIGVTSGTLDPDQDFGNVGLRWQKDETWGSYYVTTLQSYDNVCLENALIYSDNIYFAKAALAIGENVLKDYLGRLGFNEQIPFPIVMAESTFSNSGEFDTEIQLADSGYGQGQIMVNPLHLACMYTAFLNQGNMLAPRLLKEDGLKPEIWKENVFDPDAVQIVARGMTQVIENPGGTGHACAIEGLTLAGKTGTAEIKASQEDTTGTELGWLVVYTPDKGMEDSVCIVAMVEDVKERGGSGYVTEKVRKVLNERY